MRNVKTTLLALSARLRRVSYWLDHYLLRWLAPIFIFISLIIAYFLDIDIDTLKRVYPGWNGVWKQLDGLNLVYWLFLSTLIASLSSLYNAYRSRSLKLLNAQVQELQARIGAITENVPEVMDNALKAICKKLLVDESGDARVSIYIHNHERKTFVPCGRFSYDPVLRQKGRTELADDVGCIASAWRNEWHFVDNLPDPSAGRLYNDRMARDYNIPRDVSRRLRMKPRTIAAKRLSVEDTAVAVIVVESTRPDKYLEQELRGLIDELSPMYARLLIAFRPYIPDPGNAQKMGL